MSLQMTHAGSHVECLQIINRLQNMLLLLLCFWFGILKLSTILSFHERLVYSVKYEACCIVVVVVVLCVCVKYFKKELCLKRTNFC